MLLPEIILLLGPIGVSCLPELFWLLLPVSRWSLLDMSKQWQRVIEYVTGVFGGKIKRQRWAGKNGTIASR